MTWHASKQVTSPPWNSRRLVHSKEMVWASRWSVALRTFYRQILSLLYSSFFFWNFRPRLARELLVSSFMGLPWSHYKHPYEPTWWDGEFFHQTTWPFELTFVSPQLLRSPFRRIIGMIWKWLQTFNLTLMFGIVCMTQSQQRSCCDSPFLSLTCHSSSLSLPASRLVYGSLVISILHCLCRYSTEFMVYLRQRFTPFASVLFDRTIGVDTVCQKTSCWMIKIICVLVSSWCKQNDVASFTRSYVRDSHNETRRLLSPTITHFFKLRSNFFYPLFEQLT